MGASGLPAHRPLRTAAATWALTVLALGAVAANATAQEKPAQRSDSVLVRVDSDASARERAEVRRALDAEAVRTLVAGWRAYELPEAITLSQARARLADADAAGSVQLDSRLRALETPNDTHFALQWPLQAIGAPSAWDSTGAAAPVTVAVIDTGVDTSHPDLSSRLWTNSGETLNGLDDDANGYVDDVQGWNFYDGTNEVYNAADGDSHGTHVAGIIAARRGNGAGIAGVADNVRIMPLKFLKPGGGYTSDAIVAIQYAIANGASIINASWGGGGYSQALCEAIAQAGDAGVLFVVAAGNAATDNDATPMWPANCPAASLVSVAATAQDDGLAYFSNRGVTQVDLGAPGLDVVSTIPGGGYGYKSGTSMAAPVVTAIAATVAGLHPTLVPWQLKATLTGGGDPVPALAGLTVSGRRADLVGALAVAGAGVGPDTAPPDPFALLSPASGLVTTSTVPVFRWAPAGDGQSGVAGYRLTVDGATAAEVAPGLTQAAPAAPLAEGVHRWSVSAVDANGNRRESDPRTLIVDRTAPTAPAPSSPADGARPAGPELTLVWKPSTDAVSGVGGYDVIVDGAVVARVGADQHAVRVSVKAGRHTWSVRAADAAGNESAGPVRSFTVAGLRLSPPPRGVSEAAPTTVRVQLAQGARVTFSVRRVGGDAGPVRFVRSPRAGTSEVALPGALVRRMRAGGVYLVSARAPGGMADSLRLAVR